MYYVHTYNGSDGNNTRDASNSRNNSLNTKDARSSRIASKADLKQQGSCNSRAHVTEDPYNSRAPQQQGYCNSRTDATSRSLQQHKQ
jgi:hypothetical protein